MKPLSTIIPDSVVWINNDGLTDAMNTYRALGDCTAAFELFKLIEADCDQINRPVPIPENHPLYSNQCHHWGTAIIALVIRWTDRDCGRKDDTRYTERLSFLGDCPPVFDYGGALSKLTLSVRIWLSHFSYRVGGIVGST